MTLTHWRLAEAAAIAVCWPLVFCFAHLVDGSRPWVTEFEFGAIAAGVGLRVFDAARVPTRFKDAS